MKLKLKAAFFAGLLSVTASTGCSEDAEAESEDDHDHDHDDDHEDDHDDDDDDHDHDHENELITTVTLTFTSEDGESVSASFEDLDGDGGASGTTENLVLAPETTYSVRLELLNDLEDEPEDVTEEIAEEAEEHFVFLYGPNVAGPSSTGDGFLVHEFSDLESDYTENVVGDDLPVGIESTVTTSAAGDGRLSVIVRHLPDLNDVPQKTAELPDAFARGEAIAGSNDVDVTFEVRVE